MVWVKSELAEELAVVAAWLSALIPWSVSVALGSIAGSGTLIQLNFPFFLVRFLYNIELPGDNVLVLSPVSAIDYYGAAPGPVPFQIWTVAAGVLVLAVVLSLGMYVFEERFQAARFDPVRVMGGLLLVSAILLSVSSFLLKFSGLPIDAISSSTFPGVLLPIGVVFQYLFAYTLLRVERVEEPPETTDDPSPPTGSESPDTETGDAEQTDE